MLNWRASVRKRNAILAQNTSIHSRVKEEVRKYAYSNGTQAAINCFKLKYPQYTFLRTSINNWKGKFNKQKEDLLTKVTKNKGSGHWSKVIRS